MSRSIKLYLDDILASINKIKKYTAQMNLNELLEDEKTLDAVIFIVIPIKIRTVKK